MSSQPGLPSDSPGNQAAASLLRNVVQPALAPGLTPALLASEKALDQASSPSPVLGSAEAAVLTQTPQHRVPGLRTGFHGRSLRAWQPLDQRDSVGRWPRSHPHSQPGAQVPESGLSLRGGRGWAQRGQYGQAGPDTESHLGPGMGRGLRLLAPGCVRGHRVWSLEAWSSPAQSPVWAP